jgi:hypothetical protein
MTSSTRRILLQYLPPLYFTQGFDPRQYHLMPLVLQPFFIEEQRKQLPFNNINNGLDFDPRELYNTVSMLVQETGGHPRRLEALFQILDCFFPVAQVLRDGSKHHKEGALVEDKYSGIKFSRALSIRIKDNQE